MLPIELLVCIAFVVDLLCGDPRWLPHPIRLIGYVAEKAELVSRKHIKSESWAGFITVLLVLGFSGGGALLVVELGKALHPIAGNLAAVYLLYTTIALKDLSKHSLDVYDALRDNDIERARNRVAMIVGRQTDKLDEEGISRACVESVSENLVDGITAPLFWAMIGGPVGAMVYKAVNTMDSMFGYKNTRYLNFGKVAARLDDLCNYLPARVTAFMVVCVSGVMGFDRKGAWRIWRRDRRKHASPNSAQTEAAFAGALGIRMGGPNRYFGTLVEKPYIGEPKDAAQADHIRQANQLLYGATFATLSLFAVVRLLLA
nr:cobalamin biosynthesis protein CobD [Desulfobulbaceae bacterium]